MVRDGVRPGQKRRTHGSRALAAGRPCTTDDETRAPVVRESRKWTSAHVSRRGAGNIIQWAGGDFKDPEGKHMSSPAGEYSTTLPGYGGARGGRHGGDLLPDGTCAGLGRARPRTRITEKEARRETPFGTDLDLRRSVRCGCVAVCACGCGCMWLWLWLRARGCERGCVGAYVCVCARVCVCAGRGACGRLTVVRCACDSPPRRSQ